MGTQTAIHLTLHTIIGLASGERPKLRALSNDFTKFHQVTSVSIHILRRTDRASRRHTAHPNPPPRPGAANDSAQHPRILAAISSMDPCSPLMVQSSIASPPSAACIRARACEREARVVRVGSCGCRFVALNENGLFFPL